MGKTSILLLSVTLFAAGGYIVPPVEKRNSNADAIALRGGFEKESISAGDFTLRLYRKKTKSCGGATAHLYIEGDGLAWISTSKLSSDPTPANPVALKLAVKDPYSCTLYLGRPCQYLKSPACKKVYWSSKRYSGKVISAYQKALSDLKKRYGISRFKLFGFSGGGAIALIIAAKRNDIRSVCTVSGNLDTAKWAEMHHLRPLKRSINPADLASSLQKVRQYHFAGGKDTNTGKKVLESYLSHFSNKSYIHYKVIPGYTHSCCWERSWRSILKQIR